MTDLKWLDSYSGQSTAELIAMEQTHRTDSLVLAFEQGIGQRGAIAGHDGLSETEMAVLAVEALEREVNNGGYAQFFTNSSVEFAPRIVDALALIGCPKTAHMTARAISALRVPRGAAVEELEAAMNMKDNDRDRLLGQCDDEYFANDEDIAGRLFAYIKEHAGEVRLPV